MTWLALISLLSQARLCSSGAANEDTAEAAESAAEPASKPSCFNRNASRDSMAWYTRNIIHLMYTQIIDNSIEPIALAVTSL